MSEKNTVTACLILIGNEILSGRTQDKNLVYIAKGLNKLGVQMREVRVIPNVRETIVDTLNECRAKFDYVFTTGGIGPTHDDITSECVAAAFGVGMYRDPDTVALLTRRTEERGEVMNEARLRMATFPEGSVLLQQKISAAPGYRIENVFVMAGVPRIMQRMFQEAVPHITGGRRMLARGSPWIWARAPSPKGWRRFRRATAISISAVIRRCASRPAIRCPSSCADRMRRRWTGPTPKSCRPCAIWAATRSRKIRRKRRRRRSR